MKFKNNSNKNHHIQTSRKDVFLSPGDVKKVDERTITKAELGRVKKVLTVIVIKEVEPKDSPPAKFGNATGSGEKKKDEKKEGK